MRGQIGFTGQITAKTVERIRYDQIDDMMMTIGGSMLGLTLGCVRCHEHKYDPIPQTDYYRFYAIFNQTEDADRFDDAPRLDLPVAAQKNSVRIKPEVQPSR